jgi:hypothetical protein
MVLPEGEAMNLSDAIMGLVNEHGASFILRERVLLLKEQYAAKSVAFETVIANLEAKVVALERKVSVLEAEKGVRQIENRALRHENESLRKQILGRDKLLRQRPAHGPPATRRR